jgi:phosphohistidine swiveling domain-containing protein
VTIRWLNTIRATDVRSVGGKGANLGELTSVGQPVPAGFVVDVETCDVVRSGRFPEQLEHEIADALRVLGEDVAVAVRSSGVAEDGANASYAGINETFHGVLGTAGVIEAVLKCCASADTRHASEYTKTRAADGGDTGFAVVVQRQIDSAVAGVAFSADPATGNPARIVIEAARGHGEAVVSGLVTPDRVVVDKATLSVVESSSGSQRVALEASAQGLVRRKLSESEASSLSLRDDQIEQLTRSVLAIENHYGGPQDVEWAFDADGGLWILQARAITTIEDGDEAVAAARLYDRARPATSRWTRANIGEAVPGVPTPLTWSLWGPATDYAQWTAQVALGVVPAAEHGSALVTTLVQGWPAISVDLVESQLRRLPGFDAEAFAEQFFGGGTPAGDEVPIGERTRSAARVVTHAPAALRGLRRRLERAAAASEAAWQRDAWNLTGNPVMVLRSAADRFRETLAVHTLQTYACQGLYQAVERLLDQHAAEVISGDGDLSEARLADDLWKVAQGELDERSFLRRHGFHGPAEGELAVPSWREDPTPIRRAIEQMRAASGNGPASGTAARSQRRRQREADLLAAVPRWRRPVVRWLIEAARRAVVAREVGKSAIIQDLDVARAAARAIGEHAVWCTIDELAGQPPGPAVRRARARERERLAASEPPLHFVGLPRSANPEPGGDLDVVSGIGASPGRVRGRARLIVDPAADSRPIAPDEILVARTTDPSWVSTFLAAGGLVIDVGGALSHAAIIARELGVPCVIGTGNGTHVIPDGADIEIDGTTGLVRLMKES